MIIYITSVIKDSLAFGIFPFNFKTAFVKPLIKNIKNNM